MSTEKTNTEDYRALALKASLTLPHENIQALLTDADRIEGWLLEPQAMAKLAKEKQRDELLKAVIK